MPQSAATFLLLEAEKEGQVSPQVLGVKTKVMEFVGSSPHQLETVVRTMCRQLGAREPGRSLDVCHEEVPRLAAVVLARQELSLHPGTQGALFPQFSCGGLFEGLA